MKTWWYGAALPAQSVGMDLYWYSNTHGWRQGRIWALPMHVSTKQGTYWIGSGPNSRC